MKQTMKYYWENKEPSGNTLKVQLDNTITNTKSYIENRKFILKPIQQ